MGGVDCRHSARGLSAVRATVVGGEPIAKGPGLESQVAALMRTLVEAVASR